MICRSSTSSGFLRSSRAAKASSPTTSSTRRATGSPSSAGSTTSGRRTAIRASRYPIPPLRFGGSLVYEHEAFGTQIDVLRAQLQHRVAQNELPTDGYTLLSLSFTYVIDQVGPFTPLLFLRMSNLADETARESTSFLKDIAPLPGRSFSGGVRVSF